MSYYPHVKQAIGASEEIFEYMDRKPQVPPEGSLAPKTLKGHVEFKNVTFAYPDKDKEKNDKTTLKVSMFKDSL